MRPGNDITDFGVYYRGSYRINLWVSNGAGIGATECPNSVGENFESWCWRTPSVKGASYAPLVLCNQWKDMQPYPEDAPPQHKWDIWTSGPTNEKLRCKLTTTPYLWKIWSETLRQVCKVIGVLYGLESMQRITRAFIITLPLRSWNGTD